MRRATRKRCFDVVVALGQLPWAVPCGIAIATGVYVTSGSPVFFTQTRVGKDRHPFTLWKFRTMTPSTGGLQVTTAQDRRITNFGRWLRKTKLDELPQMINILRGEMSWVGPRPEVPAYVTDDPAWERILSVPPGLTDLASIMFSREEELLQHASAPSEAYRKVVLPRKLALSLRSIRESSTWNDCVMIRRTLALLWGGDRDARAQLFQEMEAAIDAFNRDNEATRA